MVNQAYTWTVLLRPLLRLWQCDNWHVTRSWNSSGTLTPVIFRTVLAALSAVALSSAASEPLLPFANSPALRFPTKNLRVDDQAAPFLSPRPVEGADAVGPPISEKTPTSRSPEQELEYEHSFLLCLLEHALVGMLSSPIFGDKTEHIREMIPFGNSIYDDIQRRSLDPKLVSCCKGVLDFFKVITGPAQPDATAPNPVETLADVGSDALQSAAMAQQLNQTFNTGFAGGDAALLGAGLSALYSAFELWQRDQDVQREVAAQRAKRLSELLQECASTARHLEHKFGWPTLSAGFANSDLKFDILFNPSTAELALQNERLKRLSPMRPRDPFIKMKLAGSLSRQTGISGQSLMYLAVQQQDAEELVPTNPNYAVFRFVLAYGAAETASKAFGADLRGRSWDTAKCEAAAFAAERWAHCLELYPDDTAGELREEQAWALFASGRKEDANAVVTKVAPLRQMTPKFAVNMARLQSARGDALIAFGWLEHAIKNLGYSEIAQARNDPDLAAVRAALPSKFDDLLSPKWSWRFNFGLLFGDDIIITNDSSFPLTNVVFKPYLESAGEVLNLELKVDRIAPGKEHKWVNVGWIPRNDQSENVYRTTLKCDQSP